jgi:hypothetical protein
MFEDETHSEEIPRECGVNQIMQGSWSTKTTSKKPLDVMVPKHCNC